MTTEEFIEKRKQPDWKFNSIVDKDDFLDVNKIHPLKQNIVKNIVLEAKKDDNINRVIIFGSSTRYDCDLSSDLDICIDWNRPCYDEEGILKPFTRNIRRHIDRLTDGRADIVDYGYLSGTPIEDAVNKGVTVYVQDV